MSGWSSLRLMGEVLDKNMLWYPGKDAAALLGGVVQGRTAGVIDMCGQEVRACYLTAPAQLFLGRIAAPIAAAVPVPVRAPPRPAPLVLGGYVSEDGGETTPTITPSTAGQVCSNCGSTDVTESNSPDWFCASCWELLNDDN